VDENSHDPSLTARILPWAIDVGVPESDGTQLMNSLVVMEIVLPREFCDAIGTHGTSGT
jgi:hypothetical protein